ncbi:DUF5707 domain-containing protein [Actinacidiphila guanduensis]|uniref:Uncharacterized protein n=1 Tax=Actinacidiphila guanduensis TaxID=310781 RepID=A0A1H0Q2D4_9ACTN|nr:DUF5707 domain-containing protein [Actinacidiphila guanduensis]SDP11185.1 hypothetical protein SAMN05216259_11795 [Actinacidiphila guanduensis]
MSKKLVGASLVSAAAVAAGTVVLVTSAGAAAPAKPAITKATARYAPSTGGADARLTVTATVADNSGVQGLKVLAWPASSGLAPKAAEMKAVENATCKATSSTASVCTYTVEDSAKDAAAMPAGTWYVSVLATAKDRGTTFAPKAATFTVKH